MSGEHTELHSGATGRTHYSRDPALQYEEERAQARLAPSAEAATLARDAAEVATPMSAPRQRGRLPKGERK